MVLGSFLSTSLISLDVAVLIGGNMLVLFEKLDAWNSFFLIGFVGGYPRIFVIFVVEPP